MKMRDFKHKVLAAVKKIPRGDVSTYQEIARQTGRPRAYRAVGNILNKNCDLQIPCHRVIRSNGAPGGFNRETKIKKAILRKGGAL